MEEKSVYIEPDLESQAQDILNSLGIDLQSVYTNILQKIVNKEISPDEIISISNPLYKKETPVDAMGILKGKFWVADDFDEPLEDFDES